MILESVMSLATHANDIKDIEDTHHLINLSQNAGASRLLVKPLRLRLLILGKAESMSLHASHIHILIALV